MIYRGEQRGQQPLFLLVASSTMSSHVPDILFLPLRHDESQFQIFTFWLSTPELMLKQ